MPRGGPGCCVSAGQEARPIQPAINATAVDQSDSATYVRNSLVSYSYVLKRNPSACETSVILRDLQIDPDWLNLIGQCVSLYGGVLLGLDAIGAAGFLKTLESTDRFSPRMARLSYIATLNNAFVAGFVDCLGLFALLAFGVALVPSLMLAPFTYMGWKLVASVGDTLANLVQRAGPPTQSLIDKGGHAGCAIGCLWLIPWTPLYLAAAVGAMAIRFGLDIPLRYISEKVIAPLVMRMLRYTARLEAEDQRWHFRTNAFRGLLWVIVGFFYQAVATLLNIAAKS